MSNIIDKIRLSGTDYTLSATSSGVSVVEVTQAEYDALPSSAKTDTSKMYVITDAEAGDLTNYYTKTETNSAITQATSGKQDTLVSGTNIKTINNESILGSGNIDIQGGGGKAIEAGRGISVTTGETADTVSFNLPISASSKSSGNYINIGVFYDFDSISRTKFQNVSIGSNNIANSNTTIFHGDNNTSNGNGSFINGYHCQTNGLRSNAFGDYIVSNNADELSTGKYNVSNKASTTFGDSGNTLFSVGNGTADDARHNAFEIRQNGDIYYFDGTNDVKLQDKFSSIDTTIGDINTILQSI